MAKQRNIIPLFTILFILLLIISFISYYGLLKHVSFINSMFSPFQKIILSTSQHMVSPDKTTLRIQEENNELHKQLIDQEKMQAENKALKDQLETTTISTRKLLLAHIVGAPGFIPNATAIEYLVIDKGSHDGIKEGMAVVYKDNLVGKVVTVTGGFSQVAVVSNRAITFAAKTEDTHALGIVMGQSNGDILFNNVILSQTLKSGQLVMTNGDTTVTGQGFPPNLIVGKIVSIQKDPSALFQQANIKSLIDISQLENVFVMVHE